MATVRGPLMSLDASGTVGDAITYSKWKGRNYVRERIIPANPKSGAQVGRRAMLTFLSQQWTTISDAWKLTYQDLADQLVTSTFNAYLSANLQRWHNFQSPAVIYPAAEINNGSDRALTAAAWEENRVKLSHNASTANAHWGIVFFAKLTGAVTPAVGNAIIVEPDKDNDAKTTFWTPPETGRWYFNSMTFSTDGVIESPGGAQDTGA